jgi:hypothetical protein
LPKTARVDAECPAEQFEIGEQMVGRVRRRSTAGSLAGVLRPHPRWSNARCGSASGSKNRRIVEEHPDPGPPCNTTTGRPSGLPQASQ